MKKESDHRNYFFQIKIFIYIEVTEQNVPKLKLDITYYLSVCILSILSSCVYN